MKRVLVGMSGGVDSSVTAFLLKEQGYDVIGVTLNLWSYEDRQEPYNECCSLEVRAVAEQLGIAHHFVDAGRVFHERVIQSFLSEHHLGQTPSPCGRCNRLVRFPVMLELAERWGCDLLATGHHARIAEHNGIYYLLTGRDPLKDQSYFLYGLGQAQLRKILFPVGHLLKSEVWKIAQENRLVSARKPESMDLCFIPGGNYRAYLKQRLDGATRPGEIVTSDGRVVGSHEGLAFYTIGQRKGLGIALGEPFYVVGFDYEKNRLIVGSESALLSPGLIVGDVHWVYPVDLTPWPSSRRGKGDPHPAPSPLKGEGRGEGRGGAGEEVIRSAEVKIRYRSPRVPATLELLEDGRVCGRFAQPQRAVTPGQLAVFYDGERVWGGGIIERALRQAEIPQTIVCETVLL
ncbi:tRNA 2-thiouridine(34) synthase MnmA [Candidatus Acetothermia bacterium]|jgi:tRNA-specific 2-thiouridylase|nr:tRNA 2-thiouridine(34) synthase MnmA [Candidatus Acetothermia bacterium]MCI2430947.1 tRNA 2-thiouridine(34) synthase MnmA [Candidatus Acetothermia bacterium]MCI2437031.1 tRNA 2-thiouridine(34) synthase MnmA [Candidatus Acetothermia bacterium]